MYSSFFLLLRFEIFDYRDREKIRRPRISKGNANVGGRGGGAHASSVTLQQGEKGNICVYIYIYILLGKRGGEMEENVDYSLESRRPLLRREVE